VKFEGKDGRLDCHCHPKVWPLVFVMNW